jgi:hypothetical protein
MKPTPRSYQPRRRARLLGSRSAVRRFPCGYFGSERRVVVLDAFHQVLDGRRHVDYLVLVNTSLTWSSITSGGVSVMRLASSW